MLALINVFSRTTDSCTTFSHVIIVSSTAHKISAIRRCSSLGGMTNSCCARVFQLIVGEREPTEIDMARSKNVSLCIKNGRKSFIPICVLTDNISLHAHASLAIQTCHLERGLVLEQFPLVLEGQGHGQSIYLQIQLLLLCADRLVVVQK